MAGPLYGAIGGRNAATAVTTITPTKAAVTAGTSGVLIAFLSTLNNDDHSCSTLGWTKVRQDNSGTGRTASLWIAAQTVSAPVFTWTNSSDAVSATVYFYDDFTNPLDTTAIGAVAVNTGTASPLTAPSITSTRNDSRFVYIVIEGNTTLGTPTGYTEHYDVAAATGGGTTIGSKYAGTPGTSSGSISVAATTTANVTSYIMWHIEIMQEVAPSPSLQTSKFETGVWADQITSLDTSKLETGVWLDQASNNFEASKIETGVWLDAITVAGRRKSTFVP